MNKFTLQLSALAFLLVGLVGCAGYQLGAVKPASYAKIERIFVPPFKNDTLEPRISPLVTNAVLKQIQMDGTYKVGSRHHCDAILRGRIERIQKFQLRGVRTDTLRSQELGLYIYIRWHLEDPKTGEEIGHSDCGAAEMEGEKLQYGSETIRTVPGVVVGDTIQFVDPSYQVGERNAVAVAAEDAAKKLVNQLSEGW